MGKSSNKRKSGPREPALVHVYSKGGVTVRAKRAFPPSLVPLVCHAFRHFIHDRVDQGAALVAEITLCEYDFFDFTMASTTNPLLGDADALTWAWGAASGSSLRWLAVESLNTPRAIPTFFTVLPYQLELTGEGSELWLLGTEIFTILARHLVAFRATPDFEHVWAGQAPRACAILKHVAAEQLADQERALLSEVARHGARPPTPEATQAARL
jgi:hypothetical protein